MKRRLSSSNSAVRDVAVGDVGLDAVTFAEGAGELAQAPHSLAEHDHLLLGRHAGERLGSDAAQERQPVPSPTDRVGHETLADQRGASAAFEWVSVSGSTLASTNTPTLPSTTPWARASSASASLYIAVPASST